MAMTNRGARMVQLALMKHGKEIKTRSISMHSSIGSVDPDYHPLSLKEKVRQRLSFTPTKQLSAIFSDDTGYPSTSGIFSDTGSPSASAVLSNDAGYPSTTGNLSDTGAPSGSTVPSEGVQS